jgi:ArsR family transcriptional regulator
MELSETLKALSDPNRLRILNLLGEGTLCVCDLEEVLKLNQSNLSRHLAKLKQAGLVTAQKKGQFMYYSRKPVAAPYGSIVENVYTSMTEQGEWKSDLDELRNRCDC